MRRILIYLALLAVSAIPAVAANLKLYLKDGGFQLVREYQVQQDRVRFYSVERSQWEEIPLELVDLKRTQSEASVREEKLAKDAKSLTQEEEERKALQKEVLRIPQDPGVYWLDKDNLHIMTAAESSMHNNKGRTALRVLTGVPQMISGKGTIEIQGARSTNVFTDPQQEFYIQVSETQPYGIIKLTPKNGVRIAENLTFEPMTKQVDEEISTVDIIIQEMAKGGLYKIWAEKPLAPGEYAVVEYTLGKLNMQIWDFAIKAK
ncbi:MAG TPA: hypothetical protein VHW24_05055 [Bryobacteraceae bacterium]|jgi:hypothetical protein|nr:hypothetical protein [Bryobacteraceae bacterium]